MAVTDKPIALDDREPVLQAWMGPELREAALSIAEIWLHTAKQIGVGIRSSFDDF